MSAAARLGVGLGIPVAATLALVPVVGLVHGTVLGFPAVIAASLAVFALTSGCMAICWLVWDRKAPDRP